MKYSDVLRVMPIFRRTHPRLWDVDQRRNACAGLYVQDLSRVRIKAPACLLYFPTLPYSLVMHFKRRRVRREKHGNDEGSSPRYFYVLFSGYGGWIIKTWCLVTESGGGAVWSALCAKGPLFYLGIEWLDFFFDKWSRCFAARLTRTDCRQGGPNPAFSTAYPSHAPHRHALMCRS